MFVGEGVCFPAFRVSKFNCLSAKFEYIYSFAYAHIFHEHYNPIGPYIVIHKNKQDNLIGWCYSFYIGMHMKYNCSVAQRFVWKFKEHWNKETDITKI